jgi:hypothetical protein
MCYGLDKGYPPKDSCVLVPNAAVFRGGTFGKLLDHEVSDIVNGLIP